MEASGCTVSILCCAEIDLTFKLPTVSKLSSMKHNFVLPEPKTCFGRLRADCRATKSLVSGQQGDETDKRERQHRKERKITFSTRTYWTGRCEPRWVGCRHLSPSQNGLPERNGTRCQALDRPQRRSPLG